MQFQGTAEDADFMAVVSIEGRPTLVLSTTASGRRLWSRVGIDASMVLPFLAEARVRGFTIVLPLGIGGGIDFTMGRNIPVSQIMALARELKSGLDAAGAKGALAVGPVAQA